MRFTGQYEVAHSEMTETDARNIVTFLSGSMYRTFAPLMRPVLNHMGEKIGERWSLIVKYDNTRPDETDWTEGFVHGYFAAKRLNGVK